MVNIQVGEGLVFGSGGNAGQGGGASTKQIKLGESLNRVTATLQESLSDFGIIQMVVPSVDRPTT